MFPNRMRAPLVVLVLALMALSAAAQFQLLPDTQPQQVFSGPSRKISLLISNASDNVVTAEVRARLHQASSATTVLVSETPWKTLQVLARQTIFESVALDFPAVGSETRFLVQWLAGTNQVAGRTEVLVYPNGLLRQLKVLAGDEPLGIFDPHGQLKLLLKPLGVEIADLEEAGMESFEGRLAIVGPFGSRGEMHEGLPKQIEALSKKGIGVIWIQPPRTRSDKIEPSFYSVPSRGHAMLLVQAQLVANLADSPQSQLNLLRLAQLALYPEETPSPYPTHEP